MKKILFLLCVFLFTSMLYAQTVTDASSKAVAQSIVNDGTRQRTRRETAIVVTPEIRNASSSIPKTLAEDVQKALANNFGTYSSMIVFIDSTTEDELNALLQFTGVTDKRQEERRQTLGQKAHYAIIPVIQRTNESKYVLSVTLLDIRTGFRRIQVKTKAYNSYTQLTSRPGAVDEAILLLCDELGVKLSSIEQKALTEGEQSLNAEDLQTLSEEKIDNAETAISILETLKRSDSTHQSFYDARIAEQKQRIGLALSDAEQLALTGQETPASTPTGEAETDALASTKEPKQKTEKPETKPVWKFGQDGMNGIYLDIGYMNTGPDLALTGLFEINNWLSVGGDIGVLMVPGHYHNENTHIIYYDYDNPDWNGSNWYFNSMSRNDDTSEMPIITSFNARVQGGVSFHRFYAYGFAGLGMYIMPYSQDTLVGLSIEGGAGLNVRFFSQHFTVGAFYKFRDFIGLGGGSSVGLTLGWNF